MSFSIEIVLGVVLWRHYRDVRAVNGTCALRETPSSIKTIPDVQKSLACGQLNAFLHAEHQRTTYFPHANAYCRFIQPKEVRDHIIPTAGSEMPQSHGDTLVDQYSLTEVSVPLH